MESKMKPGKQILHITIHALWVDLPITIFIALKCQCCPHIKTSQLICTANQLTDFYMRSKLGLNGLIDLLLPD